MTDIEVKSFKTQLELLKEINDANKMILHTVQSTALETLNKVVKPKTFIKEEQTTVELTVEEFNMIRVTLAQLSNDKGFAEMNPWIKDRYIEPKKEKEKILSMLQ